jgi:hypothetical protein
MAEYPGGESVADLEAKLTELEREARLRLIEADTRLKLQQIAFAPRWMAIRMMWIGAVVLGLMALIIFALVWLRH